MHFCFKLGIFLFCFLFFGTIALLSEGKDDDEPERPPRPMFNVTHKVYFDLVQGDRDIGRIVFGLFGDTAPKTVENFRTIATTGIDGKTYAGTNIHRVINKFLLQGGDIVNNDGSGDISIYGRTFPDETFEVKFWAPGFLAMANRGPNTNGCQFFITTMATTWLDNDYVGFGKVLEGLRTVHIIEKTETNSRGIPKVPVKIVRCGELPMGLTFQISDNPYTLRAWIEATALPLTTSFIILGIFHWMIRKLDRFERFVEEEINQKKVK